jgi:DNA-binding GntR family transcriptional regulator
MTKKKKPFYIQIRDEIKEKIENGYWVEGEMIPPEVELAKNYNVSRVTIRSAISLLVKEHYLERVAGYGTTVLRNKPDLQNFTIISSSTNEMKEMGLPFNTLSAEVKIIGATPYLASVFSINTSDKLINLRRTRGSETPILFSDTYLLPHIHIPNDEKILKGSLYEYLSTQGILFTKFDEYVSAVTLTDELRKILDLDVETPILKRKRFSYSEDDKIIEYTETFYNGNFYEYRTSINYRK